MNQLQGFTLGEGELGLPCDCHVGGRYFQHGNTYTSGEELMPIFEFACTSCDSVFEKLVHDSSEAVSCPKCGSAKLTKLLSVISSLSGAKQEGKSPESEIPGVAGLPLHPMAVFPEVAAVRPIPE